MLLVNHVFTSSHSTGDDRTGNNPSSFWINKIQASEKGTLLSSPSGQTSPVFPLGGAGAPHPRSNSSKLYSTLISRETPRPHSKKCD